MGLFTKWEREQGLVIDKSGEMESAADLFAVIDADSGRRIKVRLRRADAARIARGDRVRFVYAPEKRAKPAKEIEVLRKDAPA